MKRNGLMRRASGKKGQASDAMQPVHAAGMAAVTAAACDDTSET